MMEIRFKRVISWASCIAFCLSLAIAAQFAEASAKTTLDHSARPIVADVSASIRDGTSLASAISSSGFLHGPESLPQWFSRELLDCSEFEDVYAMPDLSIACVISKSDADEMSRRVDSELERRGWACIEEGDPYCYVKSEGECRWLDVEFSQVGREANMVMYIRRI